MNLQANEDYDSESGFLDQLNFFNTIDPTNIYVVVDEHGETSQMEPKLARQPLVGVVGVVGVVGMMVLVDNEIEHLYIHVDHQGQGIGTRLINMAKTQSAGCLELFTFQKNVRAQKFYLSHGFVEIERGCASLADNPWARSQAELKDIKYRWAS